MGHWRVTTLSYKHDWSMYSKSNESVLPHLMEIDAFSCYFWPLGKPKCLGCYRTLNHLTKLVKFFLSFPLLLDEISFRSTKNSSVQTNFLTTVTEEPHEELKKDCCTPTVRENHRDCLKSLTAECVSDKHSEDRPSHISTSCTRGSSINVVQL